MRSLIPLSLALLLDLLCPVTAIKFPFHVETATPGRRTLQGRADITGSTSGNGSVPVANTQNAFYIANITLGGQSKRVMLDTGSSDLWVTGELTSSTTGKTASLSYAVGTAAGNIETADLTFDSYTVKDQVFLHVLNTSTFSTDIVAEGYDGLIGLGPDSGSIVREKFDSDGSTGDTVLSRIFLQNQSSSNYITFMLDRRNDPGSTITGQLTVSELVPGFEQVSTMPQLAVETVHKLTDEDQHWQILLDKDGVIGPDGQPIVTESIVPHIPDGQLVAVFDSGFTLPQVPRAMSDAIYGRVPGAVYDTTQNAWTIPCGIEVNLTMKFGGNAYPIHPLDVSNDDFSITNKNGSHVCLGAFQPITSAFSLLGEYDLILGMSFLRNAYTLMDYGDFVEGGKDTASPFVQLLSVTDPAVAHRDFVATRLNGIDTTGAPENALLPASQGQHSPESAAEKKAHEEEEVLKYWPYIFVGCFVLVLVIVGLIIWRCCCRGRRARSRAAKDAKRNTFTGGLTMDGPKYQQLHEPAPPPAAMHMQPMGGYQGGYQGYQDPYSGR